MKINGVYLSYDIYDKKQMEAVQNGCKSIADAYLKIKDGSELSENEKEDIICEIYAFFSDVFGDDKTIEILGENANLTECICACADFMRQSDDVMSKIRNSAEAASNRKSKRAAVHRRK